MSAWSLVVHFAALPDPRVARSRVHVLQEMIDSLTQTGPARDWMSQAPGRDVAMHTSTDQGHGRIEHRRTIAVRLADDDKDWADQQADWPGLKALVRVERTRILNGEQTTEFAYFISSLSAPAGKFSSLIRKHWRIENSLHYVLDVTFRQDDSCIHARNAAKTLAILRAIAINMIRRYAARTSSVKRARKMAARSDNYLLELLA